MTKTKSNGFINTFKSAWWAVDLPEGWIGTEEKECVTFRGSDSLGVLQMSSARKDDTMPITDQDLREFAQTAVAKVKLRRVSYARFSGFCAEYQKEGLFWKEWWLRSGSLMLYATYNIMSAKKELEEIYLEKIINSLRPT